MPDIFTVDGVVHIHAAPDQLKRISVGSGRAEIDNTEFSVAVIDTPTDVAGFATLIVEPVSAKPKKKKPKEKK